MSDFEQDDAPEAVAVIGMAGRFPGAADLDEFWRLLDAGEEAVRPLSDAELLAAGADPAAIARPDFVKMAARVADPDLFDADFFGFSPREAEVLDPQHRVFLEVAWEALEGTGYAVPGFDGWIGVFGGTGMSSYLWNNVSTRPEALASLGEFQALIANDRDYFTTRVSYKLNLRGPSVNVQAACSTGLVAVHLACQSLLSYQTTLAIAGASRLYFPQDAGYLYQEGGIQSSDGRCRAFDAKASGAIFGDGVGAVVLKRLSEALADGDRIRAVILGSAMNNDGSFKVGYTAPSVEGQAEVIALAQAVAGVSPEEIGYVEAHGSGTPLGDPIEVAALTQAFRTGTEKRAFCALGSVKTNVGHLDNAAGIAGLIKTVLALEHERIPASLHFEEPNPRIDWQGSPFFVPGTSHPWPAGAGPRKAGVSSFGMGGTNVHAIVAEAPAPEPTAPAPGAKLLILSARSAKALEAATDRLANHLSGETPSSEIPPGSPHDHPNQVPLSRLGRGARGEGHGSAEESVAALADVAFTLSAGRTPFDHRRALVVRDGESPREAAQALAARDPRRLASAVREGEKRAVFLLSGLGEHHLGMAAGLYLEEPLFRDLIDQAAEILRPTAKVDLREVLYPGGAEAWAARSGGDGTPDLKRLLGRVPEPATPEEQRLHDTALAQPAVYAVGYALGALWRSWGVEPAALAGYSLGEYTAAALAGVFSFEDGLRLVAERARAIAALPPGAMLAVPLAEAEILPYLEAGLSLAAQNGPAQSVVAGSPEAVAALAERLADEGIASRRLPTTHAFHSPALAPAAEPLRALLAKTPLTPPRLPLFSNVTGAEMTAAEATSPDFWVRHLLEPVRFADLLSALGEPGRVLLEVGPGGALAAVALQQAWQGTPPPVLRSLPHSQEPRPARETVLEALGQLWALGVPVDWNGFWAGQKRRRVPLPTYPFERRRYFVEPRRARGPRSTAPEAAPTSPAIPNVGGEPAPATALALVDSNRPNVKTAYAEPRSDAEQRVAAIWQEVLGVHPVGAFDNFFDLGGNSLIAPRLVFALRESFGVDFPVAGLFEVPTVALLTEAVEFIAREGLAAAIASVERFDLKSEVVLDGSIDARGLPPVNWEVGEEPEAIVLTGATGFLGAYLLRDLLEHTGARLLLPTRGRDAGEALERVRENLAGRSIWKEEYAARIEALPAELGEPRWGLSETDFDRLAREAGAIYHCGAWVNFTYPYRGLKAVNVGGTVEALRLASTHRVKPLHFVSTIAVFSPLTFVDGRKAYEDDPLPHTVGLFGGYGESKWVAEQLVALARGRGIPTAVYRPGILSGDTATGSSNPRDMIWNVIKGSIQLGITHDDPALVDVTPVDYVSRAIVHLSRRPESMGHAFHFPNPHPMRWRRMVEELRAYGYPLEMIADADWLKMIAEEVPRHPDNALAPFLAVLVPPEGLEPADRMGELAKAAASAGLGELSALQALGDRLVAEQVYDETNTQAGLAGSGVTCPPLDTRLLFHYLDYFVRVGWLPLPPGGPRAEAGREVEIEA